MVDKATGRSGASIQPYRGFATVVEFCIGSILLLSSGVIADETLAKIELQTRLERGHKIAVGKCSVCHAIGLSDPSPTRINVNTAFRQLSDRFPIPMLQEAARTGYLSGHDEMPGFQFTMDDINALLTYIDSMAPARAHYIVPSGPR